MSSFRQLVLLSLVSATAFSQNVITDSATLVLSLRHGISADIQLACNTGPLSNEFTVTVSPSAGDLSVRASTGSMELLGSVNIPIVSAADPGTAAGVKDKFVLTGLLSQLQAGGSDKNCAGDLLQPNCTRTRSGVIEIHQKIVVPDTERSPLFRPYTYQVNIQCKLVPEPAKADLVPPENYIAELLDCEDFGFSLVVSALPEAAACLVELEITPGTFRSGTGYSVENCYVHSEMPPATTAVVLNGYAINGPHARVSGRKTDRSYQLTLHDMSQALAGKINCEIRQCRTGSAFPEFKECPTDALPQLVTAPASSTLRNGNALNLSPGTVTLLKGGETIARSSGTLRCEGRRL